MSDLAHELWSLAQGRPIEEAVALMDARLRAPQAPLTDEQITKLTKGVPEYEVSTWDLIRFARAIERAVLAARSGASDETT